MLKRWNGRANQLRSVFALRLCADQSQDASRRARFVLQAQVRIEAASEVEPFRASALTSSPGFRPMQYGIVATQVPAPGALMNVMRHLLNRL
jgi:hypothetical protein